MKVYTKTGDKGSSSLYDGGRVGKNCIFFNVLGELDELSSRIGMLCALIPDTKEYYLHLDEQMRAFFREHKFMRKIQSNIQDINSVIATIDPVKSALYQITSHDVKDLEIWIDHMETFNTKLTQFVLPGSTMVDAQAQLCRTQTRKVERYLWELHHSVEMIQKTNKSSEPASDDCIDLGKIKIDDTLFAYINRLSDFFFVMARYLGFVQKAEEHFYQK